LVKKARKNKRVYSRAQGGEKAMKKILNKLDMESKNTKMLESQWLSKLSHGKIIANTFGQPIVFLGIADCVTFLPLRHEPSGEADPIFLLHVNNNHWVLANVQEKEGVKSIPPPFLAKKNNFENW
jgi:hypothetical protein